MSFMRCLDTSSAMFCNRLSVGRFARLHLVTVTLISVYITLGTAQNGRWNVESSDTLDGL